MEPGNNTKPIKRSKELAPLSRDHHDGLLLCWKIKTGIEKGIENKRIASYLLDSFENDLSPHFKEEEQILFPLLNEHNNYRLEAEEQHRVLRSLINDLHKSSGDEKSTLLKFADLLSEHIRFEERVLFNLIEGQADNKILDEVGKKLAHPKTCKAEWNDPFWLNKKGS